MLEVLQSNAGAIGLFILVLVQTVRLDRARRRLAHAVGLAEIAKERAASWRAEALAAEARARGVGGQAGVKPTIDRVQA